MNTKNKVITSHGLMLLNLLFPVLVFIVLFVFWLMHKNTKEMFLYQAINEAFIAALISTFLFISANALILVFAQYKSTFALIVFEVYYIFVVPIFLIPGLLGLVKANAFQPYSYPIIGSWYKKMC